MKLKKRKPKSIAWYRRELRHIAEMAADALDAREDNTRIDKWGTALVAISATASEAAIGREAYLES